MLRKQRPANRRLVRVTAVAFCCSSFLGGAVASSAAPSTRAGRIPVDPTAVGSPAQRGVGYVTVRTPPGWGRWSLRTGVFTLRASSTCSLTLRVGAGLTSAASPTRQLRLTISDRNGENIVTGTTSSGGGVWGVQIYGPAAQFQVLGTTVVKLASRRMARLEAQLTANPSCRPTDHTEAYYGSLQHMLRTARFHIRLKTTG
jgi:hypothetical protein